MGNVIVPYFFLKQLELSLSKLRLLIYGMPSVYLSDLYELIKLDTKCRNELIYCHETKVRNWFCRDSVFLVEYAKACFVHDIDVNIYNESIHAWMYQSTLYIQVERVYAWPRTSVFQCSFRTCNFYLLFIFFFCIRNRKTLFLYEMVHGV